MMKFIKDLLVENPHIRMNIWYAKPDHTINIRISDTDNKYGMNVTIGADIYDQIKDLDSYIKDAIDRAVWQINKKREEEE